MRLFRILLFLVVAAAAAATGGAREWVYPVFKGTGPVKPLPEAQFQPEPDLRYRVLFQVAAGTLYSQADLNPDLEKVARYVNTLAIAGVPGEMMDIALIVHDRALPVVLKNQVYRDKFGADNPNLGLIGQLREKGVGLYVCGLNLADWDYDQAWVADDFQIALSYLVIVTTLQRKGYAYVPS